MFISEFGLALCERVLFANRCEPVCRTRPRACLVLLAAHLHSQGPDTGRVWSRFIILAVALHKP